MPYPDPVWADLAALAFELLAKPDYRAPVVADMPVPQDALEEGGR